MLRFRSIFWTAVIAALLLITAGMVYWWMNKPGPYPETEIFHGVFYTGLQLPETPESSGLAHIVRVHLDAPGIALYFTSVDSTALTRASQYRLDYTRRIARREDLAIAINGTLFTTDSRWYRAGQMADGVHTIVSDGEVSHVHEHSYLLWFDEDMKPNLEYRKPPPDTALENARWAIGGGEVVLRRGRVRKGTGRTPNRRTMVAIDSERNALWLAVFENASYRMAAETLAEQGAREGIMLDGGGSTTMHINRNAAGEQTGTLVGGRRPVATHIGVRADVVKSSPDDWGF